MYNSKSNEHDRKQRESQQRKYLTEKAEAVDEFLLFSRMIVPGDCEVDRGHLHLKSAVHSQFCLK